MRKYSLVSYLTHKVWIMKSILPRPRKVTLDVTDDRLTDSGGLTFLTAAARRLAVFPLLRRFLPCKQRRRGASDAENLWSMIALLACGDGTLQDHDRLRDHRANRTLLGLGHVAGSRRLGDWLRQMRRRHAESLRGIATALAVKVAPLVIDAERSARGYIPIFLDGTAIEVKGKNFVGAKTIYTGHRALWLYAAFIGRLQVSGRLCHAKGDAKGDWRTQLKRDVVPLIPADAPVWVTVDNAYFCEDFVKYMAQLGWDFSLSLTDPRTKENIVASIDPNAVWASWGSDNDPAEVHEAMYQPSDWSRAYRCIVVRRWVAKEGQRDLFPTYTVVMTNVRRLHHPTVLKRHAQKQGFENGFKGPLREMNLHHPPSASLGGNQVYYLCGLIAQILLTYLQYAMLPTAARQVGLRPLIRDLMRSVAKLTTSGGGHCLQFSKDRLRFDWLVAAMNRVDEWWEQSPI